MRHLLSTIACSALGLGISIVPVQAHGLPAICLPPVRVEQRTVTKYRTEYRTELREVQRTVQRRVPETILKEVHETVMVPVTREEVRQRIVQVPVTRLETRQREVVRTELQPQQLQRTVLVP